MTSQRRRAFVSRAGQYAAAGVVTFGLVGGLVGLVIGLDTYAPTAWFATFEIGIPAAMLGGLAGLLAAASHALVLSVAGDRMAVCLKRRWRSGPASR